MSDPAREIQAVLGRKKPAHGVAARDFRRPHRLGPERLAALRLALTNLMPALEKRIAEVNGLRLAFALATLGEVDAETLFAGAGAPLCVVRFRCNGAPAWLAWEPAAAVGVVETLLGAKGAAQEARNLSPSERKIALQLLTEILRLVTGALGLAASDLVLVQAPTELGSWREAGQAGAAAEAHRLDVALEVRLGETRSTMHFYLPSPGGAQEASAAAALAALPAHLERVEVELSACLPGCELSLDQLLALETGDVIPLEARLGDPTTLSVEGLTLAQARLGSHRGRLAVRIERLDVQVK